MATTVEQLAEQAMKLPSKSRARLADLLVESLEGDDLRRIEHRLYAYAGAWPGGQWIILPTMSVGAGAWFR
ncbi:MAG: hypothetical protein M3410_16160 [Acidobacteriota bacterium]|nr:hypothetical protein [Acidobacteriota bacterium]